MPALHEAGASGITFQVGLLIMSVTLVNDDCACGKFQQTHGPGAAALLRSKTTNKPCISTMPR